jgi:lysophospholipase L1-like esterase
MTAFTELTPDQKAYVIQFTHLDKIWPGLSDTAIAPVLGVDVKTYRSIRARFAEHARQAAAELLADPAFATRVDRLPFKPGGTVVGLGDSITDDLQSWVEILRHLLELHRPQDGIKVVNAGISGDTTALIISRCVGIILQRPDWIICMIGTNDARTHGQSPTKTYVSLEETSKNLAELRHLATTQTTARLAWITPPPVIEAYAAQHWACIDGQIGLSNRNTGAVAEVMRQLPDPVVDLQVVFGNPANPDWLLSEGIHPSLAGHKVIVTALIEQLSN